MELLTELLVMLGAMVLVVPLSLRLGLGSLPGYLLAGMLIGPSLLHLVRLDDGFAWLTELGVALLLFLIGLDLEPARLWAMRRAVVVTGGTQVILSGLLLAAVALALGMSPGVAAVIGIALALSSISATMQALRERRETVTELGRVTIAILLMQQLLVILVFAFLDTLIPDVASASSARPGNGWLTVLSLVTVVGMVVLAGRYLLRPFLRRIDSLRNDDLLTITAMFLVIAIGVIFLSLGLPITLGALLAGMLLANSGFRHEFESRVKPFAALLLGLFFVATGANLDLALFTDKPLMIVTIVLGLLVVKTGVMLVITRRLREASPRGFDLARHLAGGSEIAIVLFSFAVTAGLLTTATADVLIVAVTLSLLLAPAIFGLADRLRGRRPGTDGDGQEDRPMRLFVSYSRHDSDIAMALVEKLEQAGFKLAIDTRDLPFGEALREEIDYHIARADTVVWLASEASIRSRWCQWELDRVEVHRKRLVPVVIEKVDNARLPETVTDINLLPRNGVLDPHSAADIELLTATVLSDHAWLKEHTRLAERAGLWQQFGRSSDRLLRGGELAAAEQWRDARPASAPQPGSAILDLIHASRHAEDRTGKGLNANQADAT